MSLLSIFLSCSPEQTANEQKNSAPEQNDQPPTYYEDVAPIIQGRCTTCHQSGNIGGIDFTSYQEVKQWAEVIAADVTAKSMPPWPAADTRPYTNDWSLTPDQIETINQWVDADCPEGDPAQQASALAPVENGLSRVDLSLTMPEPYTPPVENGDDYRCFVLDWPEDTRSYLTGFHARPGNATIVHHIAAFLIRPDGLMGESVFDQVRDWDESAEGPGYGCFGGPSATGSDSQVPIEQIAQWVPGNSGWDFPDSTGIPIDPGSKIILQLHYSITPNLSDTTDQTSIDLKIDDEVASTASYAPYLDFSWPLGEMEIDAGDAVAKFETLGDPRGFFQLLNPNLQLDDGFRIYSMMLHMHRLGRSGKLEIIRADGSKETLLSIPNWDFDWQFSYHLSTPVDFHNGDELYLECVFDNSGGEAEDVNWGEGTADEMCVGNLYISPL